MEFRIKQFHLLENKNPNLPLLSTQWDAFINDFLAITTCQYEIESQKKQVLVCAQPKSASTFISMALERILGLRLFNYSETIPLDAAVQQIHPGLTSTMKAITPNHILDFTRILTLSAMNIDTACHTHTIANIQSLWHISQVKNFALIVTTRNVPDALISFRDHIVRDFKNGVTPVGARYQFGDIIWRFRTESALERFMQGTLEYQMDVMIDLYAPWMFDFLVSWEVARRDKLFDIFFMPYEELVSDDANLIARAASFLGRHVDEGQVLHGLQQVQGGRNFRFNVGKIGRGKKAMTATQVERMERLASYHGEDEILQKYL